MPFTENNESQWIIESIDDGITWQNLRNLPNMVESDWKWVGSGPPGSVQLDSGRIVVPCYHTKHLKENGILSWGHMMLSDDSGETWRLSKDKEMGDGLIRPNEMQVVDFGNNH